MAAGQADKNRLTQAGLNLIQQALTIYDADLRLAVWNRPFRDMFDLPQRLVTAGAAFEDTIRYLAERGEYGEVTDLEEFVAVRVQQARAFEPHYMERTRANGRTISVEGSPLPEGGWVAVYTDITDIKNQELLLRTRSEAQSDLLLSRAEQLAKTNRQLAATNAALEEAKRQLTEMEARTRTVTEMLPAHIAHIGRDYRYTYSNRKLNTVIPDRPQNIVGGHIRETLGDAVFSKIENHVERAFNGEPALVEFTHDDSGRRIRASFTPDLSHGGVYILTMDVTGEAQARAALSQTHKRELAAQLTNGLAHDFSNLLTIILGLQSRLERHVDQPESRALVQATRDAARRGGVLLDRISSMTSQRDAQLVSTDLFALLEGLSTMARPTIPESIELSISCEGFEKPLLLDAGSLQDALLNLVLNARDAIGPQTGKIGISARPHGGTWLELRVSDTGPGFTERALESALNPFFTTKGQEGSGLGLSMVYDTVKIGGGGVELKNTDTGAEVLLRLPLREAPVPGAPKMVLLVEDSDVIRENVRDALIALDNTVIEAASCEEALSLADLPGIDVVLSDIVLKGDATGVDLLTRLAAKDHKAIHALMTSLPQNDPRHAAAAGRFPILPKPVREVDLMQLLSADRTQ